MKGSSGRLARRGVVAAKAKGASIRSRRRPKAVEVRTRDRQAGLTIQEHAKDSLAAWV